MNPFLQVTILPTSYGACIDLTPGLVESGYVLNPIDMTSVGWELFDGRTRALVAALAAIRAVRGVLLSGCFVHVMIWGGSPYNEAARTMRTHIIQAGLVTASGCRCVSGPLPRPWHLMPWPDAWQLHQRHAAEPAGSGLRRPGALAGGLATYVARVCEFAGGARSEFPGWV